MDRTLIYEALGLSRKSNGWPPDQDYVIKAVTHTIKELLARHNLHYSPRLMWAQHSAENPLSYVSLYAAGIARVAGSVYH